jgi:hypothetical protein
MSTPDIGNRIRTRSVVISVTSEPALISRASVIHGARSTPSALSRAAVVKTSPRTEDARRFPSAAWAPRVSSVSEYTGTNAADSVPSPNRLRMMFGILMAA